MNENEMFIFVLNKSLAYYETTACKMYKQSLNFFT